MSHYVDGFAHPIPRDRLENYKQLVHEKVARDSGNEKVMADPSLQSMTEPPFDGKRIIFGGFQMVLDEVSR